MQALTTLQWVCGNNHLQSKPSWRLKPSEIDLARALWRLVQTCLAPYIADFSVDVDQQLMAILMCAAPSLQQPELQACATVTEVVNASLKRIAEDKAVHGADEPSPVLDNAGSQMFLLFWPFLGTSAIPTFVMYPFALDLHVRNSHAVMLRARAFLNTLL